MIDRELEALANQYTPRLREFFLKGIREITDNADIARLKDALANYDVELAIDIIEANEDRFSDIWPVAYAAFLAAGASLAGKLHPKDANGRLVSVRFLDPYSGDLLRLGTRDRLGFVASDMRESIRRTIYAGLQAGDTATNIVRAILGKANRANGRRSGGTLGLTTAQTDIVNRVRKALIDGDVEGVRAYLRLNKRDKSFDGIARAIIDNGVGIGKEKAAIIVEGLARNYLDIRADAIARNEIMTVLATGRDLAAGQAEQSFYVEEVTKTWNNQGDNRVRFTHDHGSLGGQTVGYSESFLSASGALIRYPHDPQAPLSETAGCRCWLTYKFRYRRIEDRRNGLR